MLTHATIKARLYELTLCQRSSFSPVFKRFIMASTKRQTRTIPEGYKEDSSKGRMLRFEDSLPNLPLPRLDETAKKYLKSVHPLVSKTEYEHTEKAVNDFIKPGGIGEILQGRLQARKDDPNVKNWLSEWFNSATYMAYRDPVVPYVSYFYSFKDDRKRRDPAKRAAAITTAALEFKKQVDEGTLEPEYMRKLPIAMSSYDWMFNACRLPKKSEDHSVKFSPKDHKHIVVARKNQFFKVIHEVNGKQLNTSELEQQFRRVYAVAESAPTLGVLTSQNRDVWADVRERLIKHNEANKVALETIESAAFLVCLDDASPVTLEERAHQFWHGEGTNRWFDKPCQFIINDNGTAGFQGEHSMMDGTPTHRLNDTVNMLIFSDKLDFENPSIRSDLPEPLPIRFNLNDQLQEDIEEARKHFSKQFKAHDLKVEAYQGYGKGLIKKFKCSPDAYIQMLIQLAYHKFYGKNRATYESIAVRRFQQGRTEVCRTVSDESVAFCDAMADPNASTEECIKLFRAALGAHTKYTSDASDGRGVDRHLFGLKKSLREGEETPAIFQDPAFAYSGSWYISTSQLSSEYFNGYGWSEVIPDGWGIAYMINENSIQFNIVSKRLGNERMSFYLNEAANETRDMMLTTLANEKAKI